MSQVVTPARIWLSVDDVEFGVSALHRGGDREPIVFLHGFGGTKEDYADIVLCTAFDGHPFVAFDAPGCGETWCANLSRVDIDMQARAALVVANTLEFKRFHLVGHSTGGLAALLLAHAHPDRVLSFVNINGNLTPEDCFVSRRIFEQPQHDAERFFDDFVECTRLAPQYASALYAAGLRHKVQAGAVGGLFRSMVQLSDHGGLLDKFVGLPCPRMFMYGAQYAQLGYLSFLRERGVELAEIADCGHFPMYSNPQRMWQHIAGLVAASAGNGVES